MSSSPSSPESSSGPRRRRRRRRGPGGQGQGPGQGQDRPQGQYPSGGQDRPPRGPREPRESREPRGEGAGEGRTRRRYSKPTPKPETTVEKVIRFLTFGIVDSRNKPQTRVVEHVPVRGPEGRRSGDRPERPARTGSESSSAPRNRERDRERGERGDRPERIREPREPREPRESREPREPREGDRKERVRDTATASRKDDNRERKPPEPVEPTNERLHVGNLDYDVTEADLYDLFNGVGSVRDAEIVYHKYTQRSKGFAFVVMASVEEAKRAFELLNGKEFMGRPMWVNGAKSAGPVDSEGESEPEAAPSSNAA
jgi:hypothetical protein